MSGLGQEAHLDGGGVGDDEAVLGRVHVHVDHSFIEHHVFDDWLLPAVVSQTNLCHQVSSLSLHIDHNGVVDESGLDGVVGCGFLMEGVFDFSGVYFQTELTLYEILPVKIIHMIQFFTPIHQYFTILAHSLQVALDRN